MTKHLSPESILQTGLAFWASKSLLSAIELGLFTVLAKGPRSLETLRADLGLHQRSARDFFDTLVALGFLERKDGMYANTPETELFLDRKKPSYVGGILEMANNRLYPFWGYLTEALRTGKPQNEAKSGAAGLFETLYSDPARLKEFLGAIAEDKNAASNDLDIRSGSPTATSNAAANCAGGYVYKVHIKPEQTTFVVDGKDTPIQAGMTVQADVVTDHRRVIEFFLSPVTKYLDEGLKVR